MPNRIQILNWRQHGDDESGCQIGVFAAEDDGDVIEMAREQVDEDASPEDWEDAEGRGDWEHVIYVNDDITIQDGDVLDRNGRKFRVNITEVTE